jgi:uncharacterized protein (TIGR03000 family)
MFHRLLVRIGIAALAAGVALAGFNPANAQHVRYSGTTHVNYAHVNVGHVGPARVPVGGAYHNYAAHYNVGYVYYGGHVYAPGYARYGYAYPRYGVGVTVGGLALGYGYPYYYGYSYPYYAGYSYPYDTGYSYPDYTALYTGSGYSDTAVPPAASDSLYPSAEPAPAPIAADTARLTVTVPADAKLWIDGQPTAQTGSVRNFQTPNLDPGRSYNYKLVAEWMVNGQPVTTEKDVSFQAGNQVMVNMTSP